MRIGAAIQQRQRLQAESSTMLVGIASSDALIRILKRCFCGRTQEATTHDGCEHETLSADYDCECAAVVHWAGVGGADGLLACADALARNTDGTGCVRNRPWIVDRGSGAWRSGTNHADRGLG